MDRYDLIKKSIVDIEYSLTEVANPDIRESLEDLKKALIDMAIQEIKKRRDD